MKLNDFTKISYHLVFLLVLSMSFIFASDNEDYKSQNAPTPLSGNKHLTQKILIELLCEDFISLFREHQIAINLIEGISTSSPEQGAHLVQIFRESWKRQPQVPISSVTVDIARKTIEKITSVDFLPRNPGDNRYTASYQSSLATGLIPFRSASNERNIRSNLFYLEIQNRIRNNGGFSFNEFFDYFGNPDAVMQRLNVVIPQGVNRPAGVYDEFRVGEAIGDGNCFFHAIFTIRDADIPNMTNLSNQIRERAYTAIAVNPVYQGYMRHEILGHYRDGYANGLDGVPQGFIDYFRANDGHQERLANIRRNLREGEEIPAILVNVPYTEEQMRNEITIEQIMDYAGRYIDRENPFYVEVPVGQGVNHGFAAVIAGENNLQINYYLYDSPNNSLSYHNTIGNGPNIVNILYNGNHFFPLFNLQENQARREGVARAFLNYVESRRVSIPSSADSKFQTPYKKEPNSRVSTGTGKSKKKLIFDNL